MRISSQYQFHVGNERIGNAQRALFEAQRRVTTGKRVETMSDDPAIAAQGIELRRASARAEQYRANIASANAELGLSEQALGEVTTVLRRANELAVKGSNGLNDQATRDGLLAELKGIEDRLLNLANSKGSKDQYLFAGRNSGTKPFEATETGVVYHGDDGRILVEVAPGETEAANVAARTQLTQAFEALTEIRQALESGDAKRLGETGLQQVQAAIQGVVSLRGDVGASMRGLDATAAHHQRRIDQFAKTISDSEDVDLSVAITEFQAAEVAYTAALQVMSRSFGSSLMDFIRS